MNVTPMRNALSRALALSFAAFAGYAPDAHAAATTEVLPPFSPVGRAVTFSIDFEHENRRGPLGRDVVENGSVVRRSDLMYQSSRDRLRLRSAGALYKDLYAFAALNFVLGDERSLDFDRRAGNCEASANACVTSSSSSLLRDGILPGFGTSPYGFNAETGKPFTTPSGRVFQGPSRSGVEYLSFGLAYAVHNQHRDPTKPTWIVAVESRLSVGTDQRFDPAKPTANRGVGPGYHQLVLSSLFSHRMGPVEPVLHMWFMQPMLTSSSVFDNAGLDVSSPQRRIGGQLGLRVDLWDPGSGLHRIRLEVHGGMEFRFRGLAQNELWEALSGDSRCATDATRCRDGVDSDRTKDGKPDPNPGVVVSPAYGVWSGELALATTVHRHVLMRALFGMTLEQRHTLTDGTSPMSAYDQEGRYFHSDAMVGWRFGLSGGAVF